MKSCPKCQAELREAALFCDKCGSSVDPSNPAAPAKSPSINWPMLIIIVLVVAFAGWLLFGKEKPGTATQAMTANPHGEGAAAATGDNPHAGGAGGGMPEDMMGQIAEAKAKLEKDPLDVDSITFLYMTYSQAGLQSRLAPFLDAALAEVDKRKDTLGDTAKDVVKQLASAALNGGDLDGAFKALLKANQMDPGDLALVRLLGDLYRSVEKWPDAITWYDKYLAQGKPEDHANYFAAMLGLGIAYAKTGDQAKSKEYLDQAEALAADELERWQFESEKAKLEGKEPPPPPAGMPGMGAAPEGMTNPHGGGGMPPATGGNPHGGMGSGG